MADSKKHERTPNEVDIALLAAERALKRALEDNPKSGVVMNRGERTEAKLSTKGALKAIRRLRSYFGDRDEPNTALCGTCKHFKKVSQPIGEAFAECRNPNGKPGFVHCYETCKNHSEKGSGYRSYL